MSRIEKAMEKAAQLRHVVGTAPVETPPSQIINKTEHIPPTPEHEPGIVVPSNPLLVNLNDPFSPIAEEYRKLKAELVKLTKGEGFFRNTLMVTSSVPNEGKSLTALNLAISLAQEYDHTVLLIDADFRRPSIHNYLGITMNKGFSDVLLGEAQINEVIIPTGIGRLSIITAGHDVPNPVELFASQKTARHIGEMKNRYNDRFIIFDTPPVLPFAESRTLAHLVDGVLFVVKEQLASLKNVKEALDALKGCGLLGTIYNDTYIDRHDEKYSSYKRYARTE
ncbi:MAG: XrtA-associated tyrosine autokinase [Desulfuromonadaceae bacterium]|nr:XrtA-associated tyrosine autokinase [Desulfuromonadaceae bacterium]MDD5104843.1 XrtA-associated tyrosine autokinase [Desulfuromonadaceae bacterium]